MLSLAQRSHAWLRRAPLLSTVMTKRNLAMKLNCGIVGLPNVGKSTLFNALVGSEAAQAANFPFCTIGEFLCTVEKLATIESSFTPHLSLYSVEPNVGLVNVPDPRLEKLGVINKSEKVLPTVVRAINTNMFSFTMTV